MWQTKGVAKNIKQPLIATYSTKTTIQEWLFPKTIKKLEKGKSKRCFAGISSDVTFNSSKPIIYHVPIEKLEEICEDDVLELSPDGTISKLFDCSSNQNALFLTEKCNSCCIMCPQPQVPIDHGNEVMKLLSCIKPERLREICLTGGEPTICSNIMEILCKLKEFPNVDPIILTNGRKFSDIQFTKQFIKNAPFNLTYAIPVYAPIPEIHDQIVGVKGGFNQTIQGIYNLTKYRVPIEIRIVLMKQNIDYLMELAEYIGWNLPMVVHVAFMGMETHGRADSNSEKVWIEPQDYMELLEKAIKILHFRDIDVSVYNMPMCLMPQSMYKYNRFSISTWKQKYLSECQVCSKKGECNGVFATSQIIPKGIHRML